MEFNENENESNQPTNSPNTKIRLQGVNRLNWELCANLELEDYQQKYLPFNLFSLAQCAYEGGEPYAVYYGEELVGFMVIAFYSSIPWITRIMIDKKHQGNGYASKALKLAINQLKQKTHVYEIRTSISKKNALAEHLFTSVGFLRKDQIDDKEFTMVLEW